MSADLWHLAWPRWRIPFSFTNFAIFATFRSNASSSRSKHGVSISSMGIPMLAGTLMLMTDSLVRL